MMSSFQFSAFSFTHSGRLLTFLIALVGLSLSLPCAAQSWNQPVMLNSTAATDSYNDDDQVRWAPATDGAGNWVAVWDKGYWGGGGVEDIYACSSSDNATSWSSAVPVYVSPASDPGFNKYPQVATDSKGLWVCVWQCENTLGGTKSDTWDILLSRSTDNGHSWSAPQLVNSTGVSDSVSDMYPSVATDTNGTWVVTWTSSASGSTEKGLWFARSTDNTQTWSSPALLGPGADTPSYSDSSPQLKTDGLGHWGCIWMAATSSQAVVYYSGSSDNGQTWSSAAALTAPFAHNDMAIRAKLAMDKSGHLVATWFNVPEGALRCELYVTRSSNAGLTWEAPTQLLSDALTDSESDLEPDLATNAQGSWMLSWRRFGSSMVGLSNTQRYVVSQDNGASWSAVQLLSNAPSVFGAPCLQSDGQQRWVAVWERRASGSDPYGTEKDLMVATGDGPNRAAVESWDMYR